MNAGAYDNDARSEATLPPVAGLSLQLDGETAFLLNAAELAVRGIGSVASDPFAMRVLSDVCINIESFADVKMNGRQIEARSLFRSMVEQEMRAGRDEGGKRVETLRSSDALRAALEFGAEDVSPSSLERIHRKLLSGTTRESFSGLLRTESRLVGGSRFHEFGSPYVTTDPADIPAMLEDLSAFCNMLALPPVAQAAIAHVQFVGIHPFARANGKTARALIQLVLQHRGLINGIVAPLSLAFVIAPHDYRNGVISALEALSGKNADASALNPWLRFFAQRCSAAAESATTAYRDAMGLQASWHARVSARAGSAASLIIASLPALPVFTVTSASAYIDRSFKRTASAVDELADAGIIVKVTEGKRNRIFECPEIIALYSNIRGFQ